MDKYGIYIHIPFCIRKCPYCDFYSVKNDSNLSSAYVNALKNEIASFPTVEADTVYFGGGTPSLLSPDELHDILDTVKRCHFLDDNSEISMECNPATADLEKLTGFRTAGINRLSIGCQSFNDGILKRLGRLHDSAQAKETVSLAKKAGFGNISVDLMLAVPDQTPEDAVSDAATAAGLGVEHVSAYLLKICEGTPFAAGVAGIPDDDTAAECYLRFSDELMSRGYGRYEISNFSLPGRESRHNLKYWDCGRWLGLGPASHMSDGCTRHSMPADLMSFISIYGNGLVADPLSYMVYEGTVDGEEYIITSLRTASGLDRGYMKQRFGQCFDREQEELIRKLVRNGLALDDGNRVSLTGEGFLVSNSILSSLI